MDNEIEQVKDKTDIVALISQYLPLKKSGRNYKGLCPFHSEKTPSFMVSPDLQIFKCFGCSRGGDVFAFLKEREGWDFREALEELARRAGVKLFRQREEKSPEESRREKIFDANELAAKFYNFLLTRHPAGRAALNYLMGRGLKSETIKKFNLGYAPNQNDLLARFLRRKSFSNSEILASGLGLISEKGSALYDRFRGRITFPLFDSRSRVVGFSGRTLSQDPNVPKYLNSPETPIFHKSQFLYGLNLAKGAIRKLGRAILVEGQMDLISNVQAGILNVVATSGSSFTVEQTRILKKLAREIVFCFDNDEAGKAALERAVEMVEVEGGLSPLVSGLPLGAKDPDEAARKNIEEWRKNLENPQSFYDYYLDLQTQTLPKSDSLGKRRAVEKLLPILARMADPLQKSHFSKQLSERLDLEERFVSEALDKLNPSIGGSRFPSARAARGEGQTSKEKSPPFFWESWSGFKGGQRLETLRKYFLVLLLRFDVSLTKKFLDKTDLLFKDSDLAPLFKSAEKEIRAARKFLKIKALTPDLSEANQTILADLLLFDLGEFETDLNLQEKEIGVAFRELQREAFKAQAASLLSQIRQAEAQGEKKALEDFQRKLTQIYQKLGKT